MSARRRAFSSSARAVMMSGACAVCLPLAALSAQPLAERASAVAATYPIAPSSAHASVPSNATASATASVTSTATMPAPAASFGYNYFTLGLRRADGLKLGGLATAALLVSTADRRGDAWARHPGVQNNATLDALSQLGDKGGSLVAVGVGPALWLLGRARGDSGTAVLGLRTTEAVVLGGVTVTAIKIIAGRTRPFASADHSPTHWDLFGGLRSDSAKSFASGHTTTATAAAVMLAAEWRRQGLRGWQTLGPPSVYALAAITAGSRVRDRQHWMSDVVSGAAVGMVSALVVRRWHDAHPGNWIDRAFLKH